MSGELSPCPFCGESNARVDDAGDMPLGHGQYQELFVVHCGCGVEGTTCNTPAIAIEAWNRRASPPPQATGALSERIAILETALTEVLEFQSAHAGPHIFDWGRWRRIRDNTPPFKRAASQVEPEEKHG